MMNIAGISNDTQRRHLVQNHKDAQGKPDLNGIDYVEVSDNNPCILLVHFLNPAPNNLIKGNVSISGGRRIRNIYAIDPAPQPCSSQDDPEPDNCLRITINQAGDFSTYTLRLVEVDASGYPTNTPLQSLDQRYAQADFSFIAGGVSDLDCQASDISPAVARVEPEINYLAKDYASFRQLILDRLALLMPNWQERHIPDVGILLVELLAYVGDHISYYQDAVANEAYLQTARRRISVRRHACLIDYTIHEGCNARAWVYIETNQDIPCDSQDIYFITTPEQVPALPGPTLTQDDLRNIPVSSTQVFLPLFFSTDTQGKIPLYQAHNSISFYTWGVQQSCLPCGATSATLKDAWVSAPTTQAPATTGGTTPSNRKLHLNPGDVLYFQEVLGAKTGNAVDADPTHRHIVRLTDVKPAVDTLYDPPVPVLEITWAQEDALPFSLCLSSLGPGCALLTDISVARGNVILVDAGPWQSNEALGTVEGKISPPACQGVDDPADVEVAPLRFTARLQKAPLCFSVPLSGDALPGQAIQRTVSLTSATALLRQDPRQALPQIKLTGSRTVLGTQVNQSWIAQQHLLESHERDLHFVVEVDNDGHGCLRFGDGVSGHQPETGTTFSATYRIGNGVSGNVGAGVISHIVFRQTKTGAILKPTNPLPASSGNDPEPLDEIKRFAPQAARGNLQRAIIPDDYARLAERHPQVQRAAAVLRWTGSNYKVLVAIEQRGKEQVDPNILAEVRMNLENYRCVGHELVVMPARLVPLDIAISVNILPHYLRAHVKADLLNVFSNRVLPDGRYGFFYRDNLSFGGSVPLSKLAALAQVVSGVASVDVTKLERIYQGTNSELTQGILSIGPLEIARMDNDRNYPENGRLTITMRGGR